MPYQKRDDYRYNSMGGINNKVSPYLNNEMEFLNIQNMDFQIPGALTKRWGSTQYFGQSLSGKVDGLYEFTQTSGSSFLYAAAGGTLGIAFNNGFSSIYSGSSGGLSYIQTYGSSGIDFFLLGASLNIDFETFNDQAFFANRKSFLKSGSGASILFFGLPRPQFAAGQYQLNVGSSGNGDGFTGLYFYKFAWINSYGLAGAPTQSYIGQSLFSAYSARATAAGATSIEISVKGSQDPFLSPFDGPAKVVPPNYDIVALGLFRAGPFDFAAGLSGPAFVSQGSVFVDAFGHTASYVALNDFDYTFIGSQGVSANSIGVTFVDTNVAGGITFMNHDILPWPWYNFYEFTSPIFGATPNPFGLTAPVGFGITLVPNFIENYSNRMWMAGMSYSPSSVWFSEFNEPEHFEADFNFDIRTNDGEPVSALKAYNGNLLIFKYSSYHLLTGDSPDNFVLTQVSNEYGCLSNRAVAEYNDILVFLDKKGIVEFNGANTQIISNKIDPIFQRMNVTAAVNNSQITFDKQRNELIIDIPVDGSQTANLSVVYDIIAKTWTTYAGYNPSLSAIAQGPLSRPEMFYGGYSGLISFFGPSFTSDNGIGFTCVAKSGFASDLGHSVSKLFRRLFIDVVPVGSGSTVGVNFYQDYGASIILSLPFQQSPFQSRIEYGIPGKALSVEFVMGSTYMLTLHGFTIEYRFLRTL
jgi:hypothetical protein